MTRELRVNLVKVKLTDRELLTVMENAARAGMNRAQFLRTSGLIDRPYTISPKLDNDQESKIVALRYHKEWRAQGNNLNQIARAINIAKLSGRNVGDYIEVLLEIRDANREIIAAVKEAIGR